MPRDASDLARRLARDAEAVCRHYLSNGRREGRYWQVGDARNTPGRSMFVRLKESTKGPAGKWTDYVAPRVMLSPGAGWLFWARSPASSQHNLRTPGRVA
ncbi:hypothetical protein ACVIJ6_002727 [Bradyrhizobium sp. USDA 4369]